MFKKTLFDRLKTIENAAGDRLSRRMHKADKFNQGADIFRRKESDAYDDELYGLADAFRNKYWEYKINADEMSDAAEEAADQLIKLRDIDSRFVGPRLPGYEVPLMEKKNF